MRIPKIREDEIIAAIDWARADAEDDFCPDYVRYSDYGLVSHQQIPSLITPCLRPDLHQLPRLLVPRSTGLLSRDTPWFPFPLRITYMLLLRRLLAALRTRLSPSCFSSRPQDWDGVGYPWRGGVSAWARFNNEYRKLLMERGSDGFAVAADVTAFYESSREFARPSAKPEEVPSFEVTGLVEGRPKTFAAFSRDVDYEAG